MLNMEKVIEVVNYFNGHDTTVRDTAKHCGLSKSTVYVYLTRIMPTNDAIKQLQKNKAERHIRGGEATKKMYLKKRS